MSDTAMPVSGPPSPLPSPQGEGDAAAGAGVPPLIDNADVLKSPFPWFGGKSRCAQIIWQRFGDVSNFVEPFAGSLAVLLARPHIPRAETVNDLDCYLANFWRSMKMDPEAVAFYADGPVNEADLHARHLWLVQREHFRERMKTDPHHYDAKIAGWWVWGISQWIGGGWCQIRKGKRGNTHWDVRPHLGGGQGIWRKRVDLKRGGRGVHSKNGEHLTPDQQLNNRGQGVFRRRPELLNGHGVHRQLPSLQGNSGATGKGVTASGIEPEMGITEWFEALAQRLRKVRVCCGDWRRVLGPTPTFKIGLTGVLLDPPYGEKAGRDADIYSHDDLQIATEVRDWAVENGGNPLLRIALCGYEGEHEMPADWECVAWKTNGGYGNQHGGKGKDNSDRERLWFSPHCLEPQPELF